MPNYYLYMMANKTNNVLYIGVTNNLERRVAEHKLRLIPGFTAKYNVTKLVYFEHGSDINAVLEREKSLKGWLRKRKNALIETLNPEWQDLSAEFYKDPSLCSG